MTAGKKEPAAQIHELVQFLFICRERENNRNTTRLADTVHIPGKHPDTVFFVIP